VIVKVTTVLLLPLLFETAASQARNWTEMG
jgi:hypothetical protein